MSKAILILPLFLFLAGNYSGQNAKKKTFGTKNINHEKIAKDFMSNIKEEKYAYCYELLSEPYKLEINSRDFEFRMKMLNDLVKKDGVHHYNTTCIGKTAKEALAMLSGEKVTKNIMPEYDFTLSSEANKDFKTVQIFLRFEHEDSDKIQVINYHKHSPINKEKGISSLSTNPFITDSYILVAEKGNDAYIDIRGGRLRDKMVGHISASREEILVKITLGQLQNFITTNKTEGYKLIHLRQVGESTINVAIREIAHENGFSVFNHDKKLSSISVTDIDKFFKKYEHGNWNPIAE